MLVFVAIVCGVRLQVYPHVEPDEAHHLIVARNLAMHGVYGSGMQATAFRPFDDYDSVGPTVIVPVAAAIWTFGDALHSGRIAMAAFYVSLSVLVFLLILQRGSATAAVSGAAFMLLAPGSLYLARTLYGEAPALAYLVAALLVWGRALRSARPLMLCVASGVLFGCALVTKYILVVAAWPALGMLLYDSMTHRRIRTVHAVVPASAALAVLGAWIAVTSVYGPHGGDTAAGLVSMYQHNLLFGVASLDTTLGWLAQHWIAALVYLGLGLLSACGASMLAAYNPAWLFLALFAALNTYWWIFFTTGTIPRYLWFGLAIGAMFAGRIFANTIATAAASTDAKVCWRGVAVSVPLLLIASWEAWPRFHAMWTRDEMRDEYAVVTHVGRAYMGKRVATSFYPIERVANVLAEFPMARVGTTDSWLGYDAVIVDRTTQPDAAARGPSVEDCGRYVIIEHGEQAR